MQMRLSIIEINVFAYFMCFNFDITFNQAIICDVKISTLLSSTNVECKSAILFRDDLV